MNCTSTNLIYIITCAGCGHNYKGEMGDVLRNRVTVHKQQIRDPHTRMLGVSKHIDECTAGSSVHYLSILQDSHPLRGHEKEQREAFYFEIQTCS